MLWLSYFGSGSSSRMPLAMFSATNNSVRGADSAMPEMSSAMEPVLFRIVVLWSSPRKCDMRQMGESEGPVLDVPSVLLARLALAGLLGPVAAPRAPRRGGRLGFCCCCSCWQPVLFDRMPAKSLGRAVPALLASNRICAGHIHTARNAHRQG